MNYQRRPSTRNPHPGPGFSRSLPAAQHVDPPGEKQLTESATHAGRTHVTRNHDVIRRWAEQRGARPATMPGSEYNGHLSVLRFDFPGYGGAVLRPVDWDEWFATFDAGRLEFRYQEQGPDGRRSNFNRLERPPDH
ncbi:hypothetical protein [Nocardia sp. NPDC050710]|uniref:hypothetical protein n=1 Tax=Nocardia sp. NPDC050710 TaxID=3157220 RepID=UPI003402B022